MGEKLARFKSANDRERFLALYDRAIEQLWPVASQEFDVQTAYGTTHGRRSGPGGKTPVVLVHPNSGTSLAWARLVAPLSERRPVYALDTIGALGRSVQTTPITGTDDLAAWMRDVLDGLGLEKVHLVGYSEGGFVAFHAALDNADRVASLVAIDAAGTVEGVRLRFLASLGWTVLKVLLRIPNAMRDFGQRMTPGVEISELEWELAMSARAFRPGLPWPRKLSDEQLRRFTIPTLLYMAENSEVSDPAKAAERANALMPHVETVIVENAQHGFAYAHPDRTVTDLLAFIARHDPASQRAQ